MRGAATYGADLLASANGDLRAALLLNEYRERRRHYAKRARELGLQYADASVAWRTKERLGARGVSVGARTIGEVHTLAFFPLVSWHSQLLRPLQGLGPLSHFDSVSTGLDHEALFRRKPAMIAARQRACEEFLRYATEVSRRRKVDWVFTYATGMELLADTVVRLRRHRRPRHRQAVVGGQGIWGSTWRSVAARPAARSGVDLCPHGLRVVHG